MNSQKWNYMLILFGFYMWWLWIKIIFESISTHLGKSELGDKLERKNNIIDGHYFIYFHYSVSLVNSKGHIL